MLEHLVEIDIAEYDEIFLFFIDESYLLRESLFCPTLSTDDQGETTDRLVRIGGDIAHRLGPDRVAVVLEIDEQQVGAIALRDPIEEPRRSVIREGDVAALTTVQRPLLGPRDTECRREEQ